MAMKYQADILIRAKHMNEILEQRAAEGWVLKQVLQDAESGEDFTLIWERR